MLTVVIAIGVAVLVVRRFFGEPINARDLLVPPVLLTGLGVHAVAKFDGLGGAALTWAAGGILAGLAMGWWRGTTIVVFDRAGRLWQRYTKWTVVVWLISFAVGAAVSYAATRSGVPMQARPMTLSIGVGLLGELISVGSRVLRSSLPARTKNG